MKTVSAANYRNDEFFAGVARAVAEILEAGNFVAPVDVLQRLGRLTRQDYEDWRFGRIPFLERKCRGNLRKMNRILRILDLHCRGMGLKPSQTTYRKWGRGGKRIILRFSKTGHPNLEAAYSRHYVAERKTDQAADETGHEPACNAAAKSPPVRTKQNLLPLARSAEKPGPSPGRKRR